ncbi:hypothetical protein [Streptomyces cinerochromogenes]|uniref:hypothetical protein n=1 Tax=Streptomyces cinerochromogenes TaxID=66422 RepID=UPI001670880C|nr:hypothetical protein [Streptomyces cinerochromogenes]GGS89439.1 hypothetical protein GCM10010206_60180 [Streptomyces cinerochromogenes]
MITFKGRPPLVLHRDTMQADLPDGSRLTLMRKEVRLRAARKGRVLPKEITTASSPSQRATRSCTWAPPC